MLAAGVLFGSTFVVMKDAVVDVEPIPFLAARFLIGALVLAPFAVRQPRSPGVTRAGAFAGVALLVGYIFQTVGLQYTSASVSAFITYMLVVLVPVLAALTVRRIPTRPTIAGVALATAGLFLLTGQGLALGKGEALTVGCAIAFAVHIVLLSEWSERFPTARFTAIQLAVVGMIALVVGAFTGGYDFPASAWLAAAYTGVVVSAVAFALQVSGQRQVGPTRTALLLMIEPVAAAGFGYAAGDRLGAAGITGAGLILAGILTAELPGLLTSRSIR
ncbi:MAG TPA: DMT family transporter [Acidimicrobiales bacterium]|nr:DMT family transporter [Acidimicrobiales bacterium]